MIMGETMKNRSGRAPLFAPTRIKVIRSFVVDGTRLAPGSVAVVERVVAESMQEVGNCEIFLPGRKLVDRECNHVDGFMG